MASAKQKTSETASRRELFRSFMRAFNPTAPAASLIREGVIYEDAHHSLFRNLAARADLEPGSQQLVVGGIGSGKTMELKMAEKWLIEHESEHQIYFDVTAETDLSDLKSGALLASFGLRLIESLDEEAIFGSNSARAEKLLSSEKHQKASSKIREFASGKTIRQWVSHDPDPDDYDHSDYEDGHYETIELPGKLMPPRPKLNGEIQAIREPLRELLESFALISDSNGHIVVICDGLDRLVTSDRFWTVVHQDCRLLKSLKVSLLATAPLAILYGRREVADYFDRVHHIPAIAVSGNGSSILEAILKKRGASTLLTPPQLEKLCIYSGGVLRDLITLARDAAEESYINGSESIGDREIDSAIEQLGTSYLRGLGSRQRSRLLAVSREGAVDLTAPLNMELLATRRILEYSASDFRVHPALLLLLHKE